MATLKKTQYVLVEAVICGTSMWYHAKLISHDKVKGLLCSSVRAPSGATVARRRFAWADISRWHYTTEKPVPKPKGGD